MKKVLILGIVTLLTTTLFACAEFINDKFSGRWAEKISERVVMDIIPDKNVGEYQIYITWRENNLAQKDIYRFNAKDDGNGSLNYKNGVHIYRYFNSDGKYEDKIDYKDGSGTFKFDKNELIWTDDKDRREISIFVKANKSLIKDTTTQNKFFSLTIPEEFKGLYEAKKDKDRISIFHIDSKKANFGGFAFGIKLYKNPADHANLPGGRKIGEFTDKKGNLYDVVLKFPTDVQYDYTKGSAPEAYEMLYNLGDIINPQAVNGCKYYKNQGMKGEDLYKEILKKHVAAIKTKTDSTGYEENNMSYMYNVIASANHNDINKVLEKVGYTYYDLNGDGIEELIIGEIANGDWKGIIYDIYTMVDRKPKHVVSGGSRNRYFVCNDSFVCNEYSGGASESGKRVYFLEENSTILFPQFAYKYDAYTNKSNPWFISYSSDIENEKWENITETNFDEQRKRFSKYTRFDFTPLSKVKF